MSEKFTFLRDGSITSPKGFLACGVAAGLKKSGKSDLALIMSDRPAIFSGAYTPSVFAAAPVQICRKKNVSQNSIRAVVINSGNANACTGQQGVEAAQAMCEYTARRLNLSADEVLVSSTGRIGVQLPMDKICLGIDKACKTLSRTGGNEAAKAIMTTDTVPKAIALEVKLSAGKVTIGGITKGAGMIAPKMSVPHATMLCYLTTDIALSKAQADRILQTVVDKSFNRINVDGDMSTNDTTLLLANGASGVVLDRADEELFSEALVTVATRLAKSMVMDAEGATKLVTVKVNNAANEADAKCLAESISNSLLCKTAWFGCDPNWGRLVAALGYSGIAFDPNLVDIFYDELPVVKHGADAGTPEDTLAAVLKNRKFTITIDMHSGISNYWMWTCDISYEYVKINAEYHT